MKYAKLGSCPEKTLDEMAKGFMGSPSWSSGKSEDGNTFVNLEGDISYMEKKVSALIQFIFNEFAVLCQNTPKGARTPGHQIKSLALYQLSYGGKLKCIQFNLDVRRSILGSNQ